jgi:hypothetical protein
LKKLFAKEVWQKKIILACGKKGLPQKHKKKFSHKGEKIKKENATEAQKNIVTEVRKRDKKLRAKKRFRLRRNRI